MSVVEARTILFHDNDPSNPNVQRVLEEGSRILDRVHAELHLGSLESRIKKEHPDARVVFIGDIIRDGRLFDIFAWNLDRERKGDVERFEAIQVVADTVTGRVEVVGADRELILADQSVDPEEASNTVNKAINNAYQSPGKLRFLQFQ